jgi:Flp pilus assembly pilin Flp
MDTPIQKICGCEIDALTLGYAMIAASISAAIIALASGVLV